MSIDKYYGAFGPHTNAKVYDSISTRVSSGKGTAIQVNDSVIPVGIKDSILNADQMVKSAVSDMFDAVAGDAVGTDSRMTPAPAYRKGMSYTIKDKFGNAVEGVLDNNITKDFAGNASNLVASGGNALSSGLSGINSTVTAAAKPLSGGVTTINGYLAPTVKSLENFSKIGKEFDKIIKQTFIGQLFNIKGTEMLCTAFCIIVSFMDCESRNNLYEAINKTKEIANAAEQTVAAINNTVASYNAAFTGATTISSTAKSLFGNDKLSNILESPFKKQGSGMSAIGGGAAIAAVPASIQQTIAQVNNLLDIISKAKVTIPTGMNGSVWDLASAVLFSFQSMVIQMADEMLSKIVKPIEDKIRKMIPQNCIGNMATIFFNKIMDSIKRFKQWILQQIAELFAASSAFGNKYKTFSEFSKELLELRFLIKSLNLSIAHFGDLAIACGVTPCKDHDKDLADAVRAGQPAPMTNIPSRTLSIDDLPKKDPQKLDEIAKKLEPILRIPAENIITGPNSITVIYPGFENVPKKISDLIQEGVLEAELGPGYTVHPYNNGKSAKVVYTYINECGE